MTAQGLRRLNGCRSGYAAPGQVGPGQINKPMGYMRNIDAWLTEQLQQLVDGGELDDFTRAVKERLLESYKNGQEQCPNCGAVKGRRFPKSAPAKGRRR